MLETKPWYQSKTIWGALIAMAAPLARHVGLDLPLADQAELADLMTVLAGTFGALLALYGRLTATKGVSG